MFTSSFPPNELKLKVSEKRKRPPNIVLSRGSISSDFCKLPYPPPHSRIFDGICPKDVTLKCVESALASFNEQISSKKGLKYELVDALNCIKDSKKDVYHCNFIARLQNESEAQDKLFFAELVYDEGPVVSCPLCCILGPRGTETGHYGCKSCLRHPGLIQHPGDGLLIPLMLSPKVDHLSGSGTVGKFFREVYISQSLEEIKFPLPESASTLSKHLHPDDGNCYNSKLPSHPSALCNFDGRCRKNTILESEVSALSSLDEPSLSKQGSHPPGICGTSPLSCYRSSPPCFDGRCPKNMISESAEFAVSSVDVQNLSKQYPVGGIRDPASRYGDPPCAHRLVPKHSVLEHAESAVSSLDVQSQSKQYPVGDIRDMFSSSSWVEPPPAPGLLAEHAVLKHAQSALSSFNEQSLSKQGPEFELIDALHCIGVYLKNIYHCNFTARLKNEVEAEDKLFFAELKYTGEVPHCLSCRILGPSGIKTGECGCRSCLRYPGLVQHPEGGFSNVYQRENVGADVCSTSPLLTFHTAGSKPFELVYLKSIESKNMISESAESAVSSSDVQSQSKQYSVGDIRDMFSSSSWVEPPPAPGLLAEHAVLKHAQSALSSFNEQSLSKQGPEFELIDALHCIGVYLKNIYHCNFTARLKNEVEAEDKLFFAELKYTGEVPHCLSCRILGPSGIKTGEYGCRSCLRYPGLVQHPEDGFSNVDPRENCSTSLLPLGTFDTVGKPFEVAYRECIENLTK